MPQSFKQCRPVRLDQYVNRGLYSSPGLYSYNYVRRSAYIRGPACIRGNTVNVQILLGLGLNNIVITAARYNGVLLRLYGQSDFL